MSPPAGRKGRSGQGGGGRHTFAAPDDTRQMLGMALELHQAGQLSRARALYQQVLSAEPRNADALQFLGLLCFQSGDAKRARGLIEQAIGEKPEVAPYHDNLGTVLESEGELEAALAAYERAAELEPGIPDRSFNTGVVLQKLDRLKDAERCYREAIRGAPQDADYHFNLGNVLKARGRAAEAVQAYRRALGLKPGSGEIRNNLGNALVLAGEAQQAVEILRQAVNERPRDPLLHNNLGNALKTTNQLEAAAASYRRALEIDPHALEPRCNLGNALLLSGDLEAAAKVFLEALERFPDSAEVMRGFVAAARYLEPSRHDARFEKALQRCTGAAGVPAQELARVAARVLCLKHGLDALSARDPLEAAAVLAAEPMALTLLWRSVNVDAGFERVLTRIRRGLLEACAGGRPMPAGLERLACALAVQAFGNEFVFAETEQEARLAGEVREALSPAAAGGADTKALSDRVVLAALYGPPGGPELAASLCRREDWPQALADLLRRVVAEPLEEARLEAGIPGKGSISEPTSLEVRAQYEASPYPRWLDPPRREPVSYREYLARRFPHFDAGGNLEGGVKVLVAGCGTGLEAVAAAGGRAGATVTGVDLSRHSLAYGLRRARELGLSNIDFVHADLLELGQADERYDVIESSGVLHHLEDPAAGLRALKACLAPGGVMKVGLYSARARCGVVAAREAIRSAGLGADLDGIRAIRRRIFEAPPGDPLAELAYSEDLYTASACRDLLFHVCEHRFTLVDVGGLLEALGLGFIGFELPHPSVATRYRAFNPEDPGLTDLNAWARFEQANPDTFAAMYVFWCH